MVAKRKGARVKSGDKVALVSPSSRVGKVEIERALENVRAMGLEPVLMPNAAKEWGFFAGTDEQRASDLNEAFRDPAYRMVWCVRGGYGAGRILKKLDWAQVRRTPKPLLGFSDITALLLGLWKRASLVCFHGPNATSCNTAFERDAVAKAVMSHDPVGELAAPAGVPEPYSIRNGSAEGVLLGGNLAVFSSLVGTPDMPNLEGAILLLEDVSEAPYRIDRMLNQIRSAGLMKDVSGLAFGRFTRCDEQDPEAPWKVSDVQRVFAEPLDFPVSANLPFGHVAEQGVLPIGAKARLSAGKLTVLESGLQKE